VIGVFFIYMPMLIIQLILDGKKQIRKVGSMVITMKHCPISQVVFLVQPQKRLSAFQILFEHCKDIL